jgi:chromosome segregation ATPase
MARFVVTHDWETDPLVPEPWHSRIWDTSTPDPVEIGADGGEPEDQTLTRDWKWVPEALNKVADEAASWQARAEAAEKALAELTDKHKGCAGKLKHAFSLPDINAARISHRDREIHKHREAYKGIQALLLDLTKERDALKKALEDEKARVVALASIHQQMMQAAENDQKKAVAAREVTIEALVAALRYIAGCGSETAMPVMNAQRTAMWFINYAREKLEEIPSGVKHQVAVKDAVALIASVARELPYRNGFYQKLRTAIEIHDKLLKERP